MELESAFSNSCESCIVPNISKNIGAENRLYNVIILMIYLYSTRMHSSRMRTARLLTVSYSAGGGGICPTPTPGYRTPMDADPPPLGYVTCDTCWEGNPPDRLTDACENITLPQTSFAGGKKFWRPALRSTEDRSFVKRYPTQLTLPDPDSNSDKDYKLYGFIVICRTFHSVWSQIQIPILTAKYKNGIGIRIGIA